MLARIFFGLVSSEPSGSVSFLTCDFVLIIVPFLQIQEIFS